MHPLPQPSPAQRRCRRAAAHACRAAGAGPCWAAPLVTHLRPQLLQDRKGNPFSSYILSVKCSIGRKRGCVVLYLCIANHMALWVRNPCQDGEPAWQCIEA